MTISYNPRIITNGLVLALDAANIKSFRGEPTTNVFTHYGTPGEGSSGDVNVTFSIQGTGTFIRLGYNQNYGGYIIQSGDVVYRYNLGTSGCHYHGNTVSIPSGSVATFSFDYYVSPETTIENTQLANFENYGGGAFGGSVSANGSKGVWQRVSFTSGPATANGTLAMFLYPGGCSPSRFGDTGYILYKNPQVEFKPYATPFVNGTRGTTVATGGGWVDLSGNNSHGELVNNPTTNTANGGSIVFDGVNDYVKATSPGTYTEYTFIFFVKWLSRTANTSRCFGLDSYGTYTIFNPDDVSYHYNPLGGSPSSTTLTSGVNVGLNTWCCVAVTESRINSEAKIYVNGVLRNTTSLVSSQGFLGSLYLGAQNTISTVIANCEIANFNLYNRVLTQSEILQNFNATRTRFGI